jgi:hypothetical protein
MRSPKENNDPYPECKNCKDIGDCPAPDVAQDLRGSPLPPEVCLRPIEIMKNTLKKRKHDRPIA